MFPLCTSATFSPITSSHEEAEPAAVALVLVVVVVVVVVVGGGHVSHPRQAGRQAFVCFLCNMPSLPHFVALHLFATRGH